MISALSPLATLRLILFPVLILQGLVLALSGCLLDWSVLKIFIKTFPWVLIFTSALLSSAGATVVVSAVWNKFFFWWRIPDMNGCWNAELYSNWPIIKGMLDGESQVGVKNNDRLKVLGELRLKMNAFAIWGDYSVKDNDPARTSRTNRSVLTSASLRKEGRYFIFSYIAAVEVTNPEQWIDSRNHSMSAELAFSEDRFTECSGTYWTNRNYETGLNTAGEIKLIKA